MVSKADKQEFLLRAVVLSFVFAIAFFTRLFSVLRFESVIHEVRATALCLFCMQRSFTNFAPRTSFGRVS